MWQDVTPFEVLPKHCHGTPAENLENMIVRFEVLTAVLLKMMWRVVGWVFSNILQDCSVFIVRVKQSKMMEWLDFKTFRNTYPMTRVSHPKKTWIFKLQNCLALKILWNTLKCQSTSPNIAGKLNLEQHCHENLKSYSINFLLLFVCVCQLVILYWKHFCFVCVSERRHAVNLYTFVLFRFPLQCHHQNVRHPIRNLSAVVALEVKFPIRNLRNPLGFSNCRRKETALLCLQHHLPLHLHRCQHLCLQLLLCQHQCQHVCLWLPLCLYLLPL